MRPVGLDLSIRLDDAFQEVGKAVARLAGPERRKIATLVHHHGFQRPPGPLRPIGERQPGGEAPPRPALLHEEAGQRFDRLGDLLAALPDEEQAKDTKS